MTPSLAHRAAVVGAVMKQDQEVDDNEGHHGETS